MTAALLALLATLSAASPAAAAPAPSFAAPALDEDLGRYPLLTSLVTSEPVRSARYEFQPWEGGPAAPPATIDVGAAVQTAWRRLLLGQLLAAPPGAAPELELELATVRHGVARVANQWKARVDVVVVVRAGGVELDRLAALGEVNVGAGADAVESAYAHAAAIAALASARAFDRSAPIGRWLAGRGLRQPAPPERPAIALSLDLGLVAYGEAKDLTVPSSLQLGVAWPRWFVRVAGGWRREVLDANTFLLGPYRASLQAMSLGAEGGLTWRRGAAWELQLGAGLYWVHAEASVAAPAVSIGHELVCGGVVAGVRWILPRRIGPIRLRLGADLRLGLDSSVKFKALDRSMDPVTGFELLVGLEPSSGR